MTSNIINANTVGVMAYNGSGNFTATPVTNHDVLVGGTSNSITSVAAGASGTALCGNGASSDPSFQTIPGIGSSLTQHYSLVGGSSNSIVSVTPSTAGFVLTSNGTSADPSFQALPTGSGFTQIKVQSFTSTGTYTPTANMSYCIVEALGGGGGGSGASAATGGMSGGGGGGGGYVKAVFTAAAVGATATVTIGAAGSGGVNVSGSAGGNTSFTGSTASITANGGGGGVLQTSSVNPAHGGTGGSGSCSGESGNSLIVNGTYGGLFAGGSGTIYGAYGAASIYGSGASQAYGSSILDPVTGLSAPANSYGSGGGSGVSLSGGNATGGAGSKGIVIVTEYIT